MEKETGHPWWEYPGWVDAGELLGVGYEEVESRIKKSLRADFGVVGERAGDTESRESGSEI